MGRQEFVIVGGGLAAATAAQTLRSEGFDGAVRLVASESHQPYIRPPLSKECLKGDAERDSVFVEKDAWYKDNDVELLLGTPASRLELDAHTVAVGSNTLHYDKLLLATGASSRRLRIDGSDAAGIHYLRSIEDSDTLREAIAPGDKRIVVVGSGWIGLEVAAAARGYGNEVTVIGRESLPLSSALGDELGAVFGRLHESNGVTLVLPADIKSFETNDGQVTGVVTGAGTLPADLVVVGVGAAPNIEVAEQAGLTIDNGIQTDEHLLTNVADVYAAGDVANAFHPVIKRHMRNEHWANAMTSGTVAAKSMLGQNVAFDEIPYFYTDQYDLGMEYSGYPPLTKEATVVYRGDVQGREFIAFWQLDGRVVAGMNVNIWDVNEQVQALIRSDNRVDAARLADDSIPLDKL